MLKRIMAGTFIVAMAVMAISCGASQGGLVKGDSFISEGWVDDNTFRVTATGVPKAGLTNRIQRRGTAKEAALAMAEKRIVEKFVGARLEGASGAADYASTGVAVAREFSGMVKGGTIVKETYDEEDNCEIIYQVESRGLKRQVTGGATALQ